ncbi:hypothetical protein CK910_22935 [Aeromonas sp. CA23]|uniref:hypothetical protein n=1 Tax=Aeromonas sp. CA23 TaxID=2033032 RepID=UPI000BFE68A1|nr:hypothetical protein [Aeromonas sp. CA23]ATM01014.1 hypothetical protein CK910_22935 [Aeromonas sp. CA23]
MSVKDDFGNAMQTLLLKRAKPVVDAISSVKKDEYLILPPLAVLVATMGVCNSMASLVKMINGAPGSTAWVTLKLRNNMSVPVLIGEKLNGFTQFTEQTILSPGEVIEISMTDYSRWHDPMTLKLYIKDFNQSSTRQVNLVLGKHVVDDSVHLGVQTISSGSTTCKNPHLNFTQELNKKLTTWWLHQEGIVCGVGSSILTLSNQVTEHSMSLDVVLFN